jgi:hypothetical protein
MNGGFIGIWNEAVAYFKGVFWSDLFQGIIPELA